MLLRRNNKLAHLTLEDRAKLDTWLKNEPYRRVVQLAAAPRPDGLALKTNLRALSHYFNKFLAPNPLDEIADLALHNPVAAQSAVSTLLLQQTIAASNEIQNRPFDVRKFNALLRLQLHLDRKASSQQWLEVQNTFSALRNSTQK